MYEIEKIPRNLKTFLFNIRRIFSKTRKNYKSFLLLCFFQNFLWNLLASSEKLLLEYSKFPWNFKKKIHWNYFKRNNLNFKQSRTMLITKKNLEIWYLRSFKESSQKFFPKFENFFLSNLENFSPKLENVLRELESFLKNFEL